MGNKMNCNTKMVMFVVVMSALISGCTGSEVNVKPDPASLQVTITKKCGNVAVKETPTDRVYPPAGNLVPGFAIALEKSGLFDKVYYPSRPDDKVDLTLDSKFDVLFDANTGSNMTKSFFTGLTLFLLEPVFWYNMDYNLNGQVEIKKENAKTTTIQAATEAGMSMKFLSLSDAQKLEGETLAKSKDSLYKQLLMELDKYCKGN